MKYFLKKYRVLKQFCNKFTYNFVFTYALIFSLFSSCVNVRLSFHFTALLLWMLSSLFYPKIFVLKKFVFLLHLYILKYNEIFTGALPHTVLKATTNISWRVEPNWITFCLQKNLVGDIFFLFLRGLGFHTCTKIA